MLRANGQGARRQELIKAIPARFLSFFFVQRRRRRRRLRRRRRPAPSERAFYLVASEEPRPHRPPLYFLFRTQD